MMTEQEDEMPPGADLLETAKVESAPKKKKHKKKKHKKKFKEQAPESEKAQTTSTEVNDEKAQPQRPFRRTSMAPQDPTQPPPRRELMKEAKEASAANIKKKKSKTQTPLLSVALDHFDEEAPPLTVAVEDQLDDTRWQPKMEEKSLGSPPGKDRDADEDASVILNTEAIPAFIGDTVTTSESATMGADYTYISAISRRDNILDLDIIKDTVWFQFPDWRRRTSAFMLLIILASVIASCGIVSDSTATVIGAMIVAPLMTPILGSMLGIVLSDFSNFVLSSTFVGIGVACAIGTGFVFALFVDEESISAENNTQVSGRISPKLLDLVAAVATGAVGAVALVRSDIAGSLPGVSIAISLVPPLNVVGVCLRQQDYEGAAGAMLLFITNYICIMFVGVSVMFLYRVHRMARIRKYHISRFGAWLYQKVAILFVLGMLVIVAILLYRSSLLSRDRISVEQCLRSAQYPIIAWQSNAPGVWTVASTSATRQFTFSNSRDASASWSARVAFAGVPPFPIFGDMSDIALECGVNHLDLLFIPTYTFENLLLVPLEN